MTREQENQERWLLDRIAEDEELEHLECQQLEMLIGLERHPEAAVAYIREKMVHCREFARRARQFKIAHQAELEALRRAAKEDQ